MCCTRYLCTEPTTAARRITALMSTQIIKSWTFGNNFERQLDGQNCQVVRQLQIYSTYVLTFQEENFSFVHHFGRHFLKTVNISRFCALWRNDGR